MPAQQRKTAKPKTDSGPVDLLALRAAKAEAEDIKPVEFSFGEHSFEIPSLRAWDVDDVFLLQHDVTEALARAMAPEQHAEFVKARKQYRLTLGDVEAIGDVLSERAGLADAGNS